jgi:hypothetical protein
MLQPVYDPESPILEPWLASGAGQSPSGHMSIFGLPTGLLGSHGSQSTHPTAEVSILTGQPAMGQEGKMSGEEEDAEMAG